MFGLRTNAYSWVVSGVQRHLRTSQKMAPSVVPVLSGIIFGLPQPDRIEQNWHDAVFGFNIRCTMSISMLILTKSSSSKIDSNLNEIFPIWWWRQQLFVHLHPAFLNHLAYMLPGKLLRQASFMHETCNCIGSFTPLYLSLQNRHSDVVE